MIAHKVQPVLVVARPLIGNVYLVCNKSVGAFVLNPDSTYYE